MATASPSLPTVSLLPQFGDRTYPTRDGRPMGETDLHRRLMFDLISALERFYAGQEVYVSGNLLLFYEPGNRRKHVSPDVLVTKGLHQGLRINYILWQEGLPPNIVIEVTSKSTRKEDVEHKFEIYQKMIRVAEYFLFDPFADYLDPPLQGFRLKRGRYVPIAPVKDRLLCEQLGLELQAQGKSLHLYDRQTGQRLKSDRELAEKAAEQVSAERAARQQAQEEAARLRDELKRLRKK
jgi:Uma2 family endonuclease